MLRGHLHNCANLNYHNFRRSQYYFNVKKVNKSSFSLVLLSIFEILLKIVLKISKLNDYTD